MPIGGQIDFATDERRCLSGTDGAGTKAVAGSATVGMVRRRAATLPQAWRIGANLRRFAVSFGRTSVLPCLCGSYPKSEEQGVSRISLALVVAKAAEAFSMPRRDRSSWRVSQREMVRRPHVRVTAPPGSRHPLTDEQGFLASLWEILRHEWTR